MQLNEAIFKNECPNILLLISVAWNIGQTNFYMKKM